MPDMAVSVVYRTRLDTRRSCPHVTLVPERCIALRGRRSNGMDIATESNLHIVCPKCDTVNRIHGSRLVEGPRCGRCNTALFTSTPTVLTAGNFDRHTTRNDIPVLVDFWAPWCAPCRMMGPEFEKAAATLEPTVRFAKVDTDAERGLGARFNIRSIPTLALFHRGREVARQAGALRAADIERFVRANYQLADE